MVRLVTLALAGALALAACGRAPMSVAHPADGGFGARAAGPASALVANQSYYPALRELLDRPGIKTIDIVQFNFFVDHGGDTLAILEKLVALAGRGVKIRVLIEGVRTDPRTRHAETIKRLNAGGITDVRLSAAHTVHAKGICIDGKTMLFGSTNWTVTSMGRNNETNARVESAKLGAAFTAWFEKLYAGTKQMTPTTTIDGDTALLTDTAFYDEALAMVGRAKRSLDVATYYLGYRKGREADDRKVKAFLDAVIARHDAVKKTGKPFAVRFFLDNNGISPEHHQSHTVNAAVHARDYLAKAGLTDVVTFDKYEQISHCKYIVKDAQPGGEPEALFGSTNLLASDFDEHHQLNWRTSDPGLVRGLTTYMNDRIKAGSPEFGVPAPRIL